MICVYCRREILEDERHYYSRQAGMKGLYHWKCFVEACRNANRTGSYEIENVTVNDNTFDVYPSYSLVSDR